MLGDRDAQAHWPSSPSHPAPPCLLLDSQQLFPHPTRSPFPWVQRARQKLQSPLTMSPVLPVRSSMAPPTQRTLPYPGPSIPNTAQIAGSSTQTLISNMAWKPLVPRSSGQNCILNRLPWVFPGPDALLRGSAISPNSPAQLATFLASLFPHLLPLLLPTFCLLLKMPSSPPFPCRSPCLQSEQPAFHSCPPLPLP